MTRHGDITTEKPIFGSTKPFETQSSQTDSMSHVAYDATFRLKPYARARQDLTGISRHTRHASWRRPEGWST